MGVESIITHFIHSNGSTINKQKLSKVTSSDITKTTKDAQNGCGYQYLTTSTTFSYTLNCCNRCLYQDWVFMLYFKFKIIFSFFCFWMNPTACELFYNSA